MNLTEVQERSLTDYSKPPPQGAWLPATVSSAETKVSGSGNDMISIQLALTTEGFEGYSLYDNLLTSPTSKGAGFAKKKLTGLGVDTSKETPDQEVADSLVGKDVFVKVRHEVIKDKDASGNYTVTRTEPDANGNPVPVKKAVPVEYSLYDPGAQRPTKAAPAQTAAPTTAAAPTPATAKSGPKPVWATK